MNIAIFSDNFYPELSGISDSIITLAEELTRRNHVVQFYVPWYPQRYYRESAGKKHASHGFLEKAGITRLASLPYRTGSGQGRFVIPTGLRSLAVRRFHPDVIHTQLFFGAGIEALVAARILKKPLIGTNHTAIAEYVRYSPITAKWFNDFIIRYASWYYNQCTIVTGPSRSVLEEMKRFGFHGEARVVSNPINTELFRPMAEKKRRKEALGFSNYTVIHAGRLAREKNIDVIMKAIAAVKRKIPSVMFALAGSGSAESELKTMALSLGIGDAVKFLGTLDQKTLAEAYNASEVFVITSTSETQSLVTMQALSCGLPVVAVAARALPEYVNSKNGVIVEAGNSEAVAENIIHLLTHPAVRKKLGTGGRESAEQFSTPIVASAWERIYLEAQSRYNKKP